MLPPVPTQFFADCNVSRRLAVYLARGIMEIQKHPSPTSRNQQTPKDPNDSRGEEKDPRFIDADIDEKGQVVEPSDT
jgi:hypothetical protein